MRPRLPWLIGLTFATACVAAPYPYSGPEPMGLSPTETWGQYLSSRAQSFKMRHQVHSRFFGHSQVIEGFLMGDRSDAARRFWVRALSPLGTTLFDVRDPGDAKLVVDIRVPQLDDPSAPLFLARDIRRIYFAECPAKASVRRGKRTFYVKCDLDAGESPIQTKRGPDGPDDRVIIEMSRGGVILQKCFYRDDLPTACVDYYDYRRVGGDADGAWFAHRITLDHKQLPYELTVALLEVDPTFDTAAAFARAP